MPALLRKIISYRIFRLLFERWYFDSSIRTYTETHITVTSFVLTMLSCLKSPQCTYTANSFTNFNVCIMHWQLENRNARDHLENLSTNGRIKLLSFHVITPVGWFLLLFIYLHFMNIKIARRWIILFAYHTWWNEVILGWRGFNTF